MLIHYLFLALIFVTAAAVVLGILFFAAIAACNRYHSDKHRNN